MSSNVVEERDVPVARKPEFANAVAERPKGRAKLVAEIREFAGALIVVLAACSAIFSVAGEYPLFGMLVCTVLLFLVLYGSLSWRLHGLLVMKSRLGSAYVWWAEP